VHHRDAPRLFVIDTKEHRSFTTNPKNVAVERDLHAITSRASLQMRKDEKFAVEAVAAFCSGKWWPGEDPPDAYIDVGNIAIALEVSTLTQHVTSDRGTRGRPSDDEPAIRLVKELNSELNDIVPDGTTVGLRLSAPIMRIRKTKTLLRKSIEKLITERVADSTEVEEEICGNKILLWLRHHEQAARYKKVSAVIYNRHSDPDILCNALYTLKDRIITKTRKCLAVKTKPLWLTLFNDYWLADAETYKLERIPVI
jgi:hypothetical protein